MSRVVSGVVAVIVAVLALSRPSPARSAEWLTLKVSPRVLLAEGSVTLTCRIEPHADNRELELGIENVYTSVRDLRSPRAPRLHTLQVMHVPCEAGPAYCTLRRTLGQELRTQAVIEVGGCE